ncbi:MAG: hypothetical protein ACOY0T_26670 [Myxococcota bacterium]
MMGKLILPLAIGGGLLLLMSSSSQASPSQGGGTYDSLPTPLKQLVVQAYATQDPSMFDLVATRLDAQGYHAQAQLLRSQGQELRTRQAGSATSVAPSVATPIPTTTAVPQPTTAVATSSVPPFVPAPDTSKALPPEFQTMMAQALQNGTVPVLTSTAFVLEKAGYTAAAEELRKRARDIASTVPPPPAQDRPNVALDPNMPSDLALEVARQLQLQGDPAVLEALAAQMRQRGFNNTADQLEAKAKQIRVMLDAAHTMNTINTEIQSPGWPQPSGSAPPAQTIPVTITATPPAPLPVPSAPQPQAPPVEKSKSQILAEAVATSLNDLISRYGSVPKARYKEDTALVKRFQTQESLTADGLYGPTSAEHIARYVSDVPPPFHWKKGAGQKDLSRYRSNIESIALDAEQLGNTDRAARLRASAAKASLA